MEMKTITADDSITHVALEGCLDLAGAKSIELDFAALVCGRRKPALIDLSNVSYISSYGIRVLMGGVKSLYANGAKLVLLKPQAQVLETLRIASLLDLIPVEEDEAKARTSLGL
jgi:anti-sigma B factor antagonist